MIMGVLFVAAISTIVAFPVVLAALLVLGLPLTVLLDRRQVAPVARDLVLLAVAAIASLLLAAPFYSPADPSSGWIFPLYAVAAEISGCSRCTASSTATCRAEVPRRGLLASRRQRLGG